jgi:hypothetical protein
MMLQSYYYSTNRRESPGGKVNRWQMTVRSTLSVNSKSEIQKFQVIKNSKGSEFVSFEPKGSRTVAVRQALPIP